uniref:Uncharacterized protein n=1 Tax=Arundo donax TaxID=35708 RepID=A0A0A9BGA9_ARUDO
MLICPGYGYLLAVSYLDLRSLVLQTCNFAGSLYYTNLRSLFMYFITLMLSNVRKHCHCVYEG